MSELKPYHVLLFTLAALALLLGLVLIFPQDGIQLGKEANLKFVTYSELVDSNQVEYKDLTNILNDSALDAANLPVIYNAQIDHNFSDSLLFKPPQIGGYAETVKVEIGDLMQVSHPIQFPNGNKKVLHSFFKALKDNTELVRVIHYGDSQIEGDRITSFIRNQLQMQFGGSGLGMIPAVQAYNYDKSVTHRTSGNWRRYNVKEHAKFIKGRRFGAHLSFARFAPLTDIDESLFLQSDSLSMDTVFGEVPKEESSEKKAPITTDPESGRVYTGWLRFIANEKTYTTNREYKVRIKNL